MSPAVPCSVPAPAPPPLRRPRHVVAGVTVLALLLAACSGGGSGSAPSGGGATGSVTTATPTPTPTSSPSAACSLRARQDWVATQVREFYLFPETLPATLDPASFTSVETYLDALTATARAQGRDRFFTFLTSIAEEDAFFASGETAAFGIRLQTDVTAGRVFVTDAYEGAPALAAGIDRGAEVLAIGTVGSAPRPVADIIAAEGSGGIGNAFGPAVAGTTRVVRINDAAGTRELTIRKADFEIPPISPRYGVQILNAGGERIGYVNLRTFITTADAALRTAFARFQAEGVTRIIIDFRYNGGGLLSTAELVGDLLGGNRLASDVLGFTTFRPEKSASNETRLFRRQSQTVRATRIAFIGTADTASASELVINAFTPYLPNDMALIGTNTFGKPVGQIARDRAECDDRLRVVAFTSQNAAREGNYFGGLATTVPATCRAEDTLALPMGDPREASTARALDFLQGRPCSPIAGAAITTQALRSTAPVLVAPIPDRPSPAQRELPGTV